MSEFFNAFGIRLDIVIAQLVNFVVLLFILYRFGYKPILQFVKDRTAKIEKGLDDAKQAANALESAQKEQEQILADSRKEAVQIIEDAKTTAKEQADAMIAKSRNEVADVVKQGKSAIEAERSKMLDEVKADVIEMVLASTQKVLSKAVDKDLDEKWLKQQLGKK